jgi:hypothetical protein
MITFMNNNEYVKQTARLSHSTKITVVVHKFMEWKILKNSIKLYQMKNKLH